MNKKLGITLFMLLVLFTSTLAQHKCKVLVESLNVQYTGKCKKGLAHGEGVAKGVDIYNGNFKKGYPHGFGVYSYANGSNFIGHYKNGLKDGYGLLNKIGESGHLVQHYGLWVADSLVVENDTKALLKVKERKGIKLIDPRVNRDVNVKNQVWINFQVDGVTDKTVVMSKAEITSGKVLDTNNRTLGTVVAFDDIEEFPVTFRLKYQIRQKTHFEMKDCVAEVMLFTRGRWEIDINH